jgi:hypothetical protein
METTKKTWTSSAVAVLVGVVALVAITVGVLVGRAGAGTTPTGTGLGRTGSGMTWGDPDRARETCQEWMDDNPSASASAGVDARQWCDAMVDWMSDHMGT